MRELKFRAWDKKQKKMLYGVSIGTIKVLDENAPLISNDFSYGEDCIFEQYTGLKDKNGKEIYEGDIVRYKLYEDSRLNYTDEVFYRTTSGSFMVGDEDNLYTLDCLVDIEVIGNIHEKPELLD